MPKRSTKDLSIALGAIEYEMHLLATALITRSQQKPRTTTGALPPLRELAAEMILIKTRSLFEFLTPARKTADQIRHSDFGVSSPLSINGRKYGMLSNLATHLSWNRSASRLPAWPQRFNEALAVLRASATVCSAIYASGITLSEKRHLLRHEQLRHQLAALRIKYPTVPSPKPPN